jgi:putative endonuclease
VAQLPVARSPGRAGRRTLPPPPRIPEAVDAAKQQKLTRLALAWLKRHELLEYPARFDVVAVTWPPQARRPRIDHYRNAFPAVGRGQMYS